MVLVWFGFYYRLSFVLLLLICHLGFKTLGFLFLNFSPQPKGYKKKNAFQRPECEIPVQSGAKSKAVTGD